MNRTLAIVFASFFAISPVAAQATDATPDTIFLDGVTADLNEFIWIKRPVVVFADSPADPRFARQMDLLRADRSALQERDIVVLTDTDPSARSQLREKLHPRGFMLVLIGKDGGVKLRKPLPWDVRELSRSIDKMPLRQQEIDESRGR